MSQFTVTLACFFSAFQKDNGNKLKWFLCVFCAGISKARHLQRTWSSLWMCEYLTVSLFQHVPLARARCLLQRALVPPVGLKKASSSEEDYWFSSFLFNFKAKCWAEKYVFIYEASNSIQTCPHVTELLKRLFVFLFLFPAGVEVSADSLWSSWKPLLWRCWTLYQMTTTSMWPGWVEVCRSSF